MQTEDKRINYSENKEAASKLLKDIVKGYACNLQASVHDGRAEIEFPVYLKNDIDKQMILEDRNGKFDFLELLKCFQPSFGRLGCLEGKYISKIKKAEVIGSRVHLDVLVN
jgi:hypothetical protein